MYTCKPEIVSEGVERESAERQKSVSQTRCYLNTKQRGEQDGFRSRRWRRDAYAVVSPCIGRCLVGSLPEWGLKKNAKADDHVVRHVRTVARLTVGDFLSVHHHVSTVLFGHDAEGANAHPFDEIELEVTARGQLGERLGEMSACRRIGADELQREKAVCERRFGRGDDVLGYGRFRSDEHVREGTVDSPPLGVARVRWNGFTEW